MPSAVRRPRSAGSVAGSEKDRARALSWGTFMKQHPRAHLLTGTYDAIEKLPKGIRSRATLLKQLAAEICRRGHHAVTTLRNFEDGDLAMVGLERQQDADRLCRAVDARIAPRFGGWLSHRSFSFDTDAAGRIAARLTGSANRRIAGTA
jgi:hypothetical protein